LIWAQTEQRQAVVPCTRRAEPERLSASPVNPSSTLSSAGQQRFDKPSTSASHFDGREWRNKRPFLLPILCTRVATSFPEAIAEYRRISHAWLGGRHATVDGKIKAARYAIAKPLLRNGL